MSTTKQTIALFLLTVFSLSACKQKQTSQTRDDFKKYYDQYKVEGSFVLYDEKKDKYIYYNPAQCKQMFTPASTFKICNSLIGLEKSHRIFFILPPNPFSTPNYLLRILFWQLKDNSNR
jgi:beta-lactamase class D